MLRSLALCVLSLIQFADDVSAQWSTSLSSHVEIGDSIQLKSNLRTAQTDAGFVYVAWVVDETIVPGDGFPGRVRLQRLDPAGNATLGSNGIALQAVDLDSSDPSVFQSISLATSGEDAIVKYMAAPSATEVVVDRVRPDGSLVFSQVLQFIGDFSNEGRGAHVVTTDGVTIAGTTEVGTFPPENAGSRLRIHRIDSQGVPLPSIPFLNPTAYEQWIVDMTPTSDGGAVFLVLYTRTPLNMLSVDSLGMQINKVAADGSQPWGSNGIDLVPSGFIANAYDLESDENGGCFLGLTQTEAITGLPQESIVQHVLVDGTFAWPQAPDSIGMPVGSACPSSLVGSRSLDLIYDASVDCLWYGQATREPINGCDSLNVAAIELDGTFPFGQAGIDLDGLTSPLAGFERLGVRLTLSGDGVDVMRVGSMASQLEQLHISSAGFASLEADMISDQLQGAGSLALEASYREQDFFAMPFGDWLHVWIVDGRIYAQNIQPGGSLGPLAGSIERTALGNPNSLSASSPVLGTTFQLSLDVASTGHRARAVFGYLRAAEQSGGFTSSTILIDTRSVELLGLPIAAGPLATFDVAVPNLASLAGVVVHTQGAHLGGGVAIELSNGVDLYLGE